ncbi:MAG: hypothetical protein ACYC7L_04750 [Nitrospirota bacterium]
MLNYPAVRFNIYSLALIFKGHAENVYEEHEEPAVIAGKTEREGSGAVILERNWDAAGPLFDGSSLLV